MPGSNSKPIILREFKIPGWLRWQALMKIHNCFTNFFLFIHEFLFLPVIIHNHFKERSRRLDNQKFGVFPLGIKVFFFSFFNYSHHKTVIEILNLSWPT